MADLKEFGAFISKYFLLNPKSLRYIYPKVMDDSLNQLFSFFME